MPAFRYPCIKNSRASKRCEDKAELPPGGSKICFGILIFVQSLCQLLQAKFLLSLAPKTVLAQVV